MILKLTSSISSELKKRALFKGTFLALLGMLLLIGGGVFLSPLTLGYWGLPLFGGAFGLMVWGLLPYRQLCALERKPYIICITDDQKFQFFAQGKQLLSLPISSIETISFQPSLIIYGIALKLNKNASEKITVYGGPSTLKHLRKGMDLHTCDLFFPYFSERAYKQLRNDLEMD